MCLCVGLCVCVGLYVCVHACGGQKPISGISLWDMSSTLIFNTGSLVDLKLTKEVRLTGHVGSGHPTQVLMPVHRELYQVSHFSTLVSSSQISVAKT